jgi:hypothetical protein
MVKPSSADVNSSCRQANEHISSIGSAGLNLRYDATAGHGGLEEFYAVHDKGRVTANARAKDIAKGCLNLPYGGE